MAGWSEVEALRALPAALDDDALAALITIPRGDRSTLQQALLRMQAIYGPPALLALTRAAFPRIDHEGIDALVLEKLLSLARELRIVMPTVDDDNFCSLHASRCIQAHLVLQRDSSIAACTAPINAGNPEEERHQDQVFASSSVQNWRSNDRRRQQDFRQRGRTPPRREGASIICYNCGLRGHVSSGCRAPRRARLHLRDGLRQVAAPHVLGPHTTLAHSATQHIMRRGWGARGS
ncbi:unnamed protein product [Lampetra fluviatilis]